MSSVIREDWRVEVESIGDGHHTMEVTIAREGLTGAQTLARDALKAHVIWNWNRLLHRSLRQQESDKQKLQWIDFLPIDDEVPLTRRSPKEYCYRFYVSPDRIKAAKLAMAQDNYMKACARVAEGERAQ
jgi:hypothetical protein